MKLVLQRRYLLADVPHKWKEWHDHPEPENFVWGRGEFETVEENMRDACRHYYEMSPDVEYRLVRRTDEVEWEFSANTNPLGRSRSDMED